MRRQGLNLLLFEVTRGNNTDGVGDVTLHNFGPSVKRDVACDNFVGAAPCPNYTFCLVVRLKPDLFVLAEQHWCTNFSVMEPIFYINVAIATSYGLSRI